MALANFSSEIVNRGRTKDVIAVFPILGRKHSFTFKYDVSYRVEQLFFWVFFSGFIKYSYR